MWQSGLRASDADREQVAERLRMAAAEGRLSAEELSDRLDAAFRARTYGELGALLADLPSPGGLVPRASGTSPVPFVRAVALAIVLAVVLPIVVPLTVVALLATVVVGHHVMAAFFPLWLVCLTVFLLLRRRRRGSYGPFDGRRGRYGGSRGVGTAGRRGGSGFWL